MILADFSTCRYSGFCSVHRTTYTIIHISRHNGCKDIQLVQLRQKTLRAQSYVAAVLRADNGMMHIRSYESSWCRGWLRGGKRYYAYVLVPPAASLLMGILWSTLALLAGVYVSWKRCLGSIIHQLCFSLPAPSCCPPCCILSTGRMVLQVGLRPVKSGTWLLALHWHMASSLHWHLCIINWWLGFCVCTGVQYVLLYWHFPLLGFNL